MKQKLIKYSFFFLLAFSIFAIGKSGFEIVSHNQDLASSSTQVDQIYHHSHHSTDKVELSKAADISSEVLSFSGDLSADFSSRLGRAYPVLNKSLFQSFQISKTPIYILVQCFRY